MTATLTRTLCIPSPKAASPRNYTMVGNCAFIQQPLMLIQCRPVKTQTVHLTKIGKRHRQKHYFGNTPSDRRGTHKQIQAEFSALEILILFLGTREHASLGVAGISTAIAMRALNAVVLPCRTPQLACHLLDWVTAHPRGSPKSRERPVRQ